VIHDGGPNIQLAHIVRHTPHGAGAGGRDAAIVDVAQDLLLRHLHLEGVLDRLAMKGGTSLRKLYAGGAGRFSTDLDFGVMSLTDAADDALTELIVRIDGLTLGPFTYRVEERRGKWHIRCGHPFGGEPTAGSKIDLGPAPWLEPVRRSWVPMAIHERYGLPELPSLQVVRLEENIAEKVARLNRTTTARDMYDLRWIMTTPAIAGALDRALIRRLAVLKIWADTRGVAAGAARWNTTDGAGAFDSVRWLRDRSQRDFDIDDIGALAVPRPSARQLTEGVSGHFTFLAALDEDEKVIARAEEQDRTLALRMLAALPGGRLTNIGLR